MRQTILVSATKKQMRQATEKSAILKIQADARRMLAKKQVATLHDQRLTAVGISTEAKEVALGGRPRPPSRGDAQRGRARVGGVGGQRPSSRTAGRRRRRRGRRGAGRGVRLRGGEQP